MREKYYLKQDRKAFLYPKQWNDFFRLLNDKQLPYFKMAIVTGRRINEICNVTPNDIDFERHQITFRITKVRAKLKETRPDPKTLLISEALSSWLKRYKNKYNIGNNEPYVRLTKVRIHQVIKEKLKKIDIKNYKDFSSHNVRKTHGSWLKALKVEIGEICSRLGHTPDTFLKHYVDANLFNMEDKILMIPILGEDLVRSLGGRVD